MMADEAPSLTLEAAITKLRAHSDIDERGQDILAAAVTLRDSRGRIGWVFFASWQGLGVWTAERR